MNISGKRGTISKTLTVVTKGKHYPLRITALISPRDPEALAEIERRNKNQQIAKADHQAVFRGNCASCHVRPAMGKHGRELFEKACGICHTSRNRASFVPDLGSLAVPTDQDYWRFWIQHGNPLGMMPAFAKEKGGPLTDAQIRSLVNFLEGRFPSMVSEFE